MILSGKEIKRQREIGDVDDLSTAPEELKNTILQNADALERMDNMKFDWNAFFKGKIEVRFATFEDFVGFLKHGKMRGRNWIGGQSLFFGEINRYWEEDSNDFRVSWLGDEDVQGLIRSANNSCKNVIDWLPTPPAFDWNRFKTQKIAVHCDTEEKARDFLKQADKHGLVLIGGSEKTLWGYAKSATCYSAYKWFGHGTTGYHKDEGFVIIDWEVTPMDKSTGIPELKAGMSVMMRNGGFYRVFTGVDGGCTLFVSYGRGFMPLDSYTDDLKVKSGSSTFDIMKIYANPGSAVLMSTENGPLLWERPEPTAEEKRIAELEKKLDAANKAKEDAEKVIEGVRMELAKGKVL